jgi:hypothetical protein
MNIRDNRPGIEVNHKDVSEKTYDDLIEEMNRLDADLLTKTKNKYPIRRQFEVRANIPFQDYLSDGGDDYVWNGYTDNNKIVVWENIPLFHEMDIQDCEEGLKDTVEYRISVDVLVASGITDKDIYDYLSLNNKSLNVHEVEEDDISI